MHILGGAPASVTPAPRVAPLAAVVLVALLPAAAGPQPAIRPLGPIMATSSINFSRGASVIPLAEGRILVNDPGRRMVLMLDSSLSNPVLVIDSTAGTGNTYGPLRGRMFPFRGDSVIFLSATAPFAIVIGPSGDQERLLPLADLLPDHPVLRTNPGGTGVRVTAGQIVSARTNGAASFQRLMYSQGLGFVAIAHQWTVPSVGSIPWPKPGESDSTIRVGQAKGIVRKEVDTRAVEVMASLSTGTHVAYRISSDGRMTQVSSEPVRYPIADDAVVTADGSIAILRGREYRIEWIDSEARRTLSPPLPDLLRDAADAAGRSPGSIPFARQGGLYADADNRIWIERMAPDTASRRIHDIVDRSGVLVDRVQLPRDAVIAGFVPGHVILMEIGALAGRLHKVSVQ